MVNNIGRGLFLVLAFMLALPMKTASAHSYDSTESANLATVRSGFDAWANGTGSPYDALAENVRWEIVGNSVASRIYTSKTEFIDNLIAPFNARMSQRLVPTIRDIYADGDTVVVFFDAEGAARDGVPYRNTYSWFLTLRDGQIVKASAFFDSIAFNDLWRRVTP
ncbi:nuclear transport factor 2 family protein [Mycobacterium adipatum]|jgi:ketosteroid isomerase-like protein|uniref:nuclear transport factor 2 family protein n=1 Tax=Mycobacterium adipatum TaxID=1682113 RepID=UPI0034E08D79